MSLASLKQFETWVLVRSEIYSSHAFMACENSADNLLRTSSVNQEKVNELFGALKLSTEDKDTGGKPEHSHG